MVKALYSFIPATLRAITCIKRVHFSDTGVNEGGVWLAAFFLLFSG